MTEQINEQQTKKIKEYDPVEAGLATLRERFKGIVFDVTTTKGMKDATAARYEIRTLRTSLEAKRKQIKAPALSYCKLIDDEAKRITTELYALETPIDEQIKAEELRKEQERIEREKREQERKDVIRASINRLSWFGIRVKPTMASSEIDKIYCELDSMIITKEEYMEFTDEATAVKTAALETIKGVYAVALDLEEKKALQEEENRKLREREEWLAAREKSLAEKEDELEKKTQSAVVVSEEPEKQEVTIPETPVQFPQPETEQPTQTETPEQPGEEAASPDTEDTSVERKFREIEEDFRTIISIATSHVQCRTFGKKATTDILNEVIRIAKHGLEKSVGV